MKGLAVHPARLGTSQEGRSPLAQLLHALNQPLTGLQCSMELALSGPRRPDQYLSVLRDGVELTGRMRVLVDAIRELVDIQQRQFRGVEEFALDVMLRETVDDLMPVAETRHIRLSLTGECGSWLRSDRGFCAQWLFRLVDAALSCTRAQGELRIDTRREAGQILLTVAWTTRSPAQPPPGWRPELGLLIARAGAEQIGGHWERRSEDEQETCMIRLPLAPASSLNMERREMEEQR